MSTLEYFDRTAPGTSFDTGGLPATPSPSQARLRPLQQDKVTENLG
jgi:hypothetical protein